MHQEPRLTTGRKLFPGPKQPVGSHRAIDCPTRHLGIADVGGPTKQAFGHVLVECGQQLNDDALADLPPRRRGQVQSDGLGSYAPESTLTGKQPVTVKVAGRAPKVCLGDPQSVRHDLEFPRDLGIETNPAKKGEDARG